MHKLFLIRVLAPMLLKVCFNIIDLNEKDICKPIVMTMKKTKLRYQKNDEGARKSILKFRDFDEDEDENLPEGHKGNSARRRKDVGTRVHREKNVKDDFWTSENKH